MQAGRDLSVDVQKANQIEGDIYDATPRKPTGPPRSPDKTESTRAAGMDNANGQPEKTNDTGETGRAPGAGPVQYSAAEFDDSEDGRKRIILVDRQEEKIVYNPDEDAAEASQTKRDDQTDDEEPQMSATSYPGMEWNPYAAGGYEDWCDDQVR